MLILITGCWGEVTCMIARCWGEVTRMIARCWGEVTRIMVKLLTIDHMLLSRTTL